MNILFTTPKGEIRDTFFPEKTLIALKKLGNVTFNDKDEPFTPAELERNIKDIDVCLTHWSCPLFTERVLQHANRLGLIAHAAGSVGDLVTRQVYERGIKVCSANQIMAKSVAEGVLAYILAGVRHIATYDRQMRANYPWDDTRRQRSKGLLGAKISLVGLGTIGRYFLDLAQPFDAQIKVYDPYLPADSLAQYPNVELCPSLDETLAWGDIISLHASLTRETRRMMSAEKLKLIKDGALFVNTARGAIVDEPALIQELKQNRFTAVLDVYEKEPLEANSPLRELENVTLLPHVASVATAEMTYAMIAEIERYARGEPLQHEISYEKFKLMTKEYDD